MKNPTKGPNLQPSILKLTLSTSIQLNSSITIAASTQSIDSSNPFNGYTFFLLNKAKLFHEEPDKGSKPSTLNPQIDFVNVNHLPLGKPHFISRFNNCFPPIFPLITILFPTLSRLSFVTAKMVPISMSSSYFPSLRPVTSSHFVFPFLVSPRSSFPTSHPCHTFFLFSFSFLFSSFFTQSFLPSHFHLLSFPASIRKTCLNGKPNFTPTTQPPSSFITFLHSFSHAHSLYLFLFLHTPPSFTLSQQTKPFFTRAPAKSFFHSLSYPLGLSKRNTSAVQKRIIQQSSSTRSLYIHRRFMHNSSPANKASHPSLSSAAGWPGVIHVSFLRLRFRTQQHYWRPQPVANCADQQRSSQLPAQ